MTSLIDALNNPTIRADIDAIDDIWMSLDRGERQEPTLWKLLDAAVAALKADHGVDYDPRSR